MRLILEEQEGDSQVSYETITSCNINNYINNQRICIFCKNAV